MIERTGAEPIRDEAGGEFVRDAEVEGKKSASDPKSPGVSGLLFDDKLCLLDRDLSTVAVDVIGAALVVGKGAPGLGVSTTRRMRGCRGADESETRDAAVSGVSGREPTAEAEPGAETNVPESARSDLTEEISWVANGMARLVGLALVSATEPFSGFATRSFSSVASRNSFFVPSRALVADFATGDPRDICETSLTRVDAEVVRVCISGVIDRVSETRFF